MINLVEVLSGRRKIQKLYEEIQDMDFDPKNIWAICLEKLNINVECNYEFLYDLPKNSPYILIANHPFGVVDGLIVSDLASKINQRFSIIVNSALTGHDYRLNDFLLPINFEETKEAVQTNINTKNLALERVQKGEVLVIFPSGGVATASKWYKEAEDLEWKRFVAKLIKKTSAPVLPVFVHGKNSRAFQIASSINQDLRLGLLMNEVRNKMGKSVKVQIGAQLTFDEYGQFKNNELLLSYLRKKVMDLSKE